MAAIVVPGVRGKRLRRADIVAWLDAAAAANPDPSCGHAAASADPAAEDGSWESSLSACCLHEAREALRSTRVPPASGATSLTRSLAGLDHTVSTRHAAVADARMTWRSGCGSKPMKKGTEMNEATALSGTKRWAGAAIGLALIAVVGAVGWVAYQDHQRREAEAAAEAQAAEDRRQAFERAIHLVSRSSKALDTFMQGAQRAPNLTDIQMRARGASEELLAVASDFGDPRLRAMPGFSDAIRQHSLKGEALVRAFTAYVQAMTLTHQALEAAQTGQTEAKAQAQRALALSLLSGHFGPLAEAAAEERRAAQNARLAREGMVQAATARDALVAAATELAEATQVVAQHVGDAVPGLALYDYAEMAQRMAAVDVGAEMTARVDQKAPKPVTATP